MPAGAVADGAGRAVVEPGQEEEDDDGAAHHHHAPELGVDGQHERDGGHGHDRDGGLDEAGQPPLDHAEARRQHDAGDEGVHHLAGDGAQHRVERREVPDGRDVRGGLERIGRDEVVVLQEVAAELGGEEHHRREDEQEHAHAEDVVHGVVRMERDAVQRMAMLVLRGVRALDLDAVGVVGAHVVQRQQVGDHQAQQHERYGDHVEAEEAVERCVAHHVVAADQQGQVGADEGDGREQVHDHLGAPVRHLAPRQQVAHEGLGHEREEDRAAEDPDQLARLAVGAVEQAAEHVQVHHDEERRGARGVHVADQPAPGHVAHDVLDGLERLGGVGLVVHHQEDAGDDLDHQHQQRERAEDVPEVEVLRSVVLRHVHAVGVEGRGEAVLEPVRDLGARGGVGGDVLEFAVSHVRLPQAFLSSPIRSLVSDRYMCGGTSRLSGAGLFLKTRPAMSKVEPWQGQRKPPFQSSGSEGCAPGVNLSLGEQPRWVQMPTATRISGLMERFSLRAYSGVSSEGLRSDLGSASWGSSPGSAASCSGERLMIQTGLPRHSTVIFSPVLRPAMSTSTAAPAALAFSEGWKVLTNGTAVATPPTAPAQPDAMSHVRLLESIGVSLMGVLNRSSLGEQSQIVAAQVRLIPGVITPPARQYCKGFQLYQGEAKWVLQRSSGSSR